MYKAIAVSSFIYWTWEHPKNLPSSVLHLQFVPGMLSTNIMCEVMSYLLSWSGEQKIVSLTHHLCMVNTWSQTKAFLVCLQMIHCFLWLSHLLLLSSFLSPWLTSLLNLWTLFSLNVSLLVLDCAVTHFDHCLSWNIVFSWEYSCLNCWWWSWRPCMTWLEVWWSQICFSVHQLIIS